MEKEKDAGEFGTWYLALHIRLDFEAVCLINLIVMTRRAYQLKRDLR